MRNLKKVIALVAVFAMMVSTVAFAATFSDVVEGNDYYEAIEMLSKLDILTGDDQDGDGVMDFRPEDTITRAEVAAVVSRIQGIASAAQTGTGFVDVPATHWASGYVAQAAGQGIVNGYGDGNFGPEDVVLYEQAVKMLVETIGYAPFVAANGGYPAGYLTAASRYGILDGVVGAAVGAPATRGQVAQMVYNAVDTPIMDRYTYGADAEYMIFDGKSGREFITLLTRDLGVKKFAGLLVESEISEGGAIDTEEPATIVVEADTDNDDYYNYEVADICGSSTVEVLLGEENAKDLVGMNVSVLVKKVKNSADYEVLSIAATKTNKVVEFTLDQFVAVDEELVSYYAKANDRKATELDVEEAIVAYYNGVEMEATDVEDAFYEAGIEENCTFSGKVTLIDNDSKKGYDVVAFEVAATAVVDEVKANGIVEFKEDALNSKGDEVKNLAFDDEDTTQIINLTKDGAAIDFAELAEWDVLSILYNEAIECYEVEVLASTAVEGSVTQKASSKTSEGGYKFRVAGKDYEVAKNCYEASKIEIGATGTFYIDAYGKIVAYDKTGAGAVADNYAFVLAAKEVEDKYTDGEFSIVVQLLDKDGNLFKNAELAEKVKIVNSEVLPKKTDNKYTISDLSSEVVGDLADELVNKLVSYDVNTAGEVDEIVLEQAADDEGSVYTAGVETEDYDEVDMELGQYDLAEDTIIFYINAKVGAMVVDGALTDNSASTTKSTVTAATALATRKDVTFKAYDVDDDDVPAVLVVFDQGAGISPATNVAVIDEVGEAYLDGENVVAVSFYMNGELVNATTYEELQEAEEISKANQGDIWKFSVVDGVIVAAEELVAYSRYADDAYAADEDGAATFAAAFDVRGEEKIYAGAVVEYKSASKKFVTSGGTFNVDADTNVYVLDPSLRTNKLKAGAASDVNVDKDIVERDAEATTINLKKTEEVLVAAGEEALGMLDYAVAYEYDKDVLDIVIYKAYDFGRFVIVNAE